MYFFTPFAFSIRLMNFQKISLHSCFINENNYLYFTYAPNISPNLSYISFYWVNFLYTEVTHFYIMIQTNFFILFFFMALDFIDVHHFETIRIHCMLSHSVVSDSFQPHGLYSPPGFSVHGFSNTLF